MRMGAQNFSLLSLQCCSMRPCLQSVASLVQSAPSNLAWSCLRPARARASVGFLGLGIFLVSGRACSHSVFCSLLQVHFVPHPKGNCHVRVRVRSGECCSDFLKIRSPSSGKRDDCVDSDLLRISQDSGSHRLHSGRRGAMRGGRAGRNDRGTHGAGRER